MVSRVRPGPCQGGARWPGCPVCVSGRKDRAGRSRASPRGFSRPASPAPSPRGQLGGHARATGRASHAPAAPAGSWEVFCERHRRRPCLHVMVTAPRRPPACGTPRPGRGVCGGCGLGHPCAQRAHATASRLTPALLSLPPPHSVPTDSGPCWVSSTVEGEYCPRDRERLQAQWLRRHLSEDEDPSTRAGARSAPRPTPRSLRRLPLRAGPPQDGPCPGERLHQALHVSPGPSSWRVMYRVACETRRLKRKPEKLLEAAFLILSMACVCPS